MDAVVPAAAPATPKKVKAVKPKAPKKVSTHPSYQDMIKKAVETLKDRGGSSRQAIQKYIQATFKTCDDKVSQAHLKIALKRGVETGLLKRVKGTGASGSFRLAQKVTKPVQPKVVKKPKVAKKPQAAKPAGEKKTVKPKTVKAKVPSKLKPKKAVAEKKASKPKMAKKPKTPKKALKPAAKKAVTPKVKKSVAKKAPAKK